MSNHMFIAAGGIPDQHNTTFRRDPFMCHLAAVSTLIDAGINPPDGWLALRGRYAAYIDLGDGATDRLIAEIITPNGGDMVALRAAALAEQVARGGDDAAIAERARVAVGRELETLYRPAAAQNYKTAAARYNDAATHFSVATKTVNVEADGGQLLTVSAPARDYWLAAPALAAELDTCRAILYAAASLIDNVPADVAFVSAASDLTTVEYQISLAADPGKAHRRKVWAAWHATAGRTGRWGALIGLGVKLRAADPASITPYAQPEALVAVTSRAGRIEYWDKHSGRLQDVMPGFIPCDVGWIEERPSVEAAD